MGSKSSSSQSSSSQSSSSQSSSSQSSSSQSSSTQGSSSQSSSSQSLSTRNNDLIPQSLQDIARCIYIQKQPDRFDIVISLQNTQSYYRFRFDRNQKTINQYRDKLFVCGLAQAIPQPQSMEQIRDYFTRTDQPEVFLQDLGIDSNAITQQNQYQNGLQGNIQDITHIDKIYEDYSNPNIIFLEQINFKKSFILDFSLTSQQRRTRRSIPENTKSFTHCKSIRQMQQIRSINDIFNYYVDTTNAGQFINIMGA